MITLLDWQIFLRDKNGIEITGGCFLFFFFFWMVLRQFATLTPWRNRANGSNVCFTVIFPFFFFFNYYWRFYVYLGHLCVCVHISTCEAIFHQGSYNHVEPIWSIAFWGSAEVMSKVYFTALVSIKASTSVLILPEPCIVYESKGHEIGERKKKGRMKGRRKERRKWKCLARTHLLWLQTCPCAIFLLKIFEVLQSRPPNICYIY